MTKQPKHSVIVGVVLGSVFLLAPAFGQTTNAPSDTAYVPLALYQGGWEMKSTSDKGAPIVHISNRCERTGEFFVCEQKISGKSEDMIVFLPTDVSNGVQHYKIEALGMGTERPGDWTQLEISGDRWVYSSEASDNGSKVFWRTVNLFSGPDKIHFDVQHSSDGKSWTTTKSGDETRVSK